jgi:amino-acid N-acetyltransferase
MGMELQPIGPAAASALLAANDLPIDDLDDPAVELFGAFAGGALVGVIGLETRGGVGLLRSLAVATAHRERGVARALCDRVLERARARSLVALYLLTTTAAAYFVRHGFVAIPRDEAPPAIRTTAQFASLCPSSATVMRRTAG